MLPAAKKKPDVDVALVLGGAPDSGKSKGKFPMMPDEPEGEGEAEAESELPEGFAEGIEEFLGHAATPEQLAGLHRAIKACGESY